MKINLSVDVRKKLVNNDKVRTVDEESICLSREFVETIYDAWLRDPSKECVHLRLVAASLDLDYLGLGASRYIDRMFKYYGRPTQDILILLQNKQPSLEHTRTYLGYDDILLRSGKFVQRSSGIGLEESLEEELFRAYPSQSVEDGLRKAGIDPMIVGSNRVCYIKKMFKKRYNACNGVHDDVPDTKEFTTETAQQYSDHPYVRFLSSGKVVLRSSFYNDASHLSELPIERILSVFELETDLFSENELSSLQHKLSSWNPIDADPMRGEPVNADNVVRSETFVKILRNRMEALQEVQDMRWKKLGEAVPGMSLSEKKELFTRLSLYVREVGISGELSRILKLMGVARSSFYGCLSNKRYGQAKLLKEQQDEEDAAKIRYVYEYKGFKKGARLVQMMLPAKANVTFSLKKVRRLMKKYGMECGVRSANPHKRASKEFLKTHVKPNLLKRRFRLGRPNKFRLTDVTYLDFGKPDENGKKQRAYGSGMLDSVTGRLVVLNISMSNDEDLVLETLRLAKEYPWIEGGIIHSDQGILYLSDEFQEEVEAMGLEQSMSKRGNSQDNAPMESFFGHFKDEVDYASCTSFQELETLLNEYTEYYNTERPMADRLGMTPVEYEAYLTGMDDEEFSHYLAGEEKKYLEKKRKAKELAIARAKTLGIDDITEDKNHGEDNGNDE